jgi:hypothetical protein
MVQISKKKHLLPFRKEMPFVVKYFSGSKFDDVLGLRAAIAFLNFKTHSVPLAEGLKSGHINAGMMNKQILSIFL